jgi:hypothetical protein
MIDLIATVIHVPQIVCVCYSTVNIGKCKQQVTLCTALLDVYYDV